MLDGLPQLRGGHSSGFSILLIQRLYLQWSCAGRLKVVCSMVGLGLLMPLQEIWASLMIWFDLVETRNVFVGLDVGIDLS